MDLRSKGRRPENNLPKSESLCSNIGCANLKRRVATVVAGMWGTMRSTASNVFHFVMIKPSHYDDDGYPIQWIRSAIPSNTLACLNALAEDARRRKILGPDVDIRLHTYDETNRRVRPDRIIRKIRKSGGRAVIGLVGSIEPVSARNRSGAPLPGGRPAGPGRRIPRVRVHCHASRAAVRSQSGTGDGHLILRRRMRRRPAR